LAADGLNAVLGPSRGKRDIRAIRYSSYVHGLLFGGSYQLTGNLVVPVIAHGLFDLGGVIYFQQRLRKKRT